MYGTVKTCTAFLKLKATDGMDTVLLPFSNGCRDLISRMVEAKDTKHVVVKGRPLLKISLYNHIVSVHVNVVKELKSY